MGLWSDNMWGIICLKIPMVYTLPFTDFKNITKSKSLISLTCYGSVYFLTERHHCFIPGQYLQSCSLELPEHVHFALCWFCALRILTNSEAWCLLHSSAVAWHKHLCMNAVSHTLFYYLSGGVQVWVQTSYLVLVTLFSSSCICMGF